MKGWKISSLFSCGYAAFRWWRGVIKDTDSMCEAIFQASHIGFEYLKKRSEKRYQKCPDGTFDRKIDLMKISREGETPRFLIMSLDMHYCPQSMI